MFESFETIHTYSNEDAVNDGLKVKCGDDRAPIYVNRNVAEFVGALDTDTDGSTRYDATVLFEILRPSLVKFLTGTHYDAGATKYPEECDESLAIYWLDGTPGTYGGVNMPHTFKAREAVWWSFDGAAINVYHPSDR